MTTPHGHYPINPAEGFPTGNAVWQDALPDSDWGPGGSFWKGQLGPTGVEFLFELAVGSFGGEGGFTYDDPGSLYDTATYASNDIYWVDLTERVRDINGGRGRGAINSPFRQGQGSVTLSNEDGLFNPQQGQQIIGDQAMRPGRWVRLSGRRSDTDTWIPLWVMRVQSLGDVYVDAAHDVLSTWSLVGLEAVLEQRKPTPLDNPDPLTAGQVSDDRVRYLWDTVMDATPELLLTPDTYDHTLQETTFPGSRLDQIHTAMDAEGGDFYLGKEGRFYFRGRDWLNSDDEPKFRIGAYATTDVVVLDAKTAWDMTRIRNAVFMQALGGALQGNIDSASQGIYGEVSYRDTSLENDNDADVVTLVDQQLGRFAYDTLRVEQVEVWSPTLDGVDNLLNVELGDVVEVTIVTALEWTYTIKAWVNEVHHMVTADDWRVKLRLDNTFRGNPSLGGPYSNAFNDDYKALPV